LLPQIGLNQFGRRQKPENGYVSDCKTSSLPVGRLAVSEQSNAQGGCARRHNSFLQERAPIRELLQRSSGLSHLSSSFSKKMW
jgi:hypothetical protein